MYTDYDADYDENDSTDDGKDKHGYYVRFETILIKISEISFSNIFFQCIKLVIVRHQDKEMIVKGTESNT